MENRVLMKWRKNWLMATILFTFIPVFCLCFISAYINIRKDSSFLIMISVLVFLLIILLVTSLKWNEFLYMDKDKIWANRKGKLVEWRYDEVITCRIIAKPSRTNNYCVEISTKSNSKKLVFACNNKIENLLLDINKGKEVWKIFHKAFKWWSSVNIIFKT